MSRSCSLCHKIGHNSASCSKKREARTVIKVEPPKKMELGILDPLIIEPKAGLWIVSEVRRTIAGRISMIRKNGAIVYENCLGAIIETTKATCNDSNYIFVELKAPMLAWKIL